MGRSSETQLQAGKNFTFLCPFLCAECYGIQHTKTGFSGERVKGYKLIVLFNRPRLNPLNPHDALKHHFASLKDDLIS